MSYQERRSLFNLVVSIIITVVFIIVIRGMYLNDRFDTTNMMKFWSLILIIYIVYSIVTRIVITILYRIAGEIRDEITGDKEDARDIVDERDKLIELKSERIANYFFMFAFIFAAISQVLDYSISTFFVMIIAGGFIGEICSYITQIVFYRRGV